MAPGKYSQDCKRHFHLRRYAYCTTKDNEQNTATSAGWQQNKNKPRFPPLTPRHFRTTCPCLRDKRVWRFTVQNVVNEINNPKPVHVKRKRRLRGLSLPLKLFKYLCINICCNVLIFLKLFSVSNLKALKRLKNKLTYISDFNNKNLETILPVRPCWT